MDKGSGKRTRATRGRTTRGPVVRVGEIMDPKVVKIGPNEAANVAWSRMQRRSVSHLVVTENGSVRGILSERDLGGRGGEEIRKGRMVQDLMTPRVVSVKSTTTLEQAANLMGGRRISSLPVLDGGRLAGIVTATEVFNELERRSARAAFPGWVPKALKRESGRTPSELVPAHIRLLGADLSKEDRESLRQKLGAKLGKFANSIERISVRVKDVNGPRGGVDQMCQIKVVLSGLPSVVFEAQDASLDIAVGRALAGIERAVRQAVQRRRMEPIKVSTRKRRLSGSK